MKNYQHDLHVEKTIGRKFALIITCFCFFSGLLVISFLTYMNSKEFERELERVITEIHLTSSETLEKALWLTNEEVVQTILFGFRNIPSVEKIVLTKDDGEVTTIGVVKSSKTLMHEHNLFYDYRGKNVWVGHISITLGFGARTERVINKTIFLAVVVGFLALAGGGLAIFLFNYFIGRHLKCIADHCKLINWKNLDSDLILKRRKYEESDELDLIVNALNSTCSILSQSLTEIQENENLLMKITENYPNSYVLIVEKDFSISFSSGQEFKKNDLDPQDYEKISIGDFFKKRKFNDLRYYENTFEGEEQFFHFHYENQYYECKTVPLYAEDHSIPRILVVSENITERQSIEYRLQQAQKMEAMGTLAGGIAHDFNNILSVIIGYTELVKDSLSASSDASKNLQNVMIASLRAKKLVQQILVFSRQDQTELVIMNPTKIINETLRMLRSSLPATIEIKADIDKKIGLILADSTQVSQILMNLATNAYHAMGDDGGVLNISLKEKNITSDTIDNVSDVKLGMFVQLSVSDSGSGIDPKVIDKIFDPFYTTKAVGKGTGMGLSIIHGIVNTYGGFIQVDSEYGQGTTFRVYLPIVYGDKEKEETQSDLSPEGEERILFVDDEEMLVNGGRELLEGLGYQVTGTTSAVEALEVFKKSPTHFDLVITDQTMPNITGTQLASQVLQIRQDIPIILSTGYTAMITEEDVKKLGIKALACKPLTKNELAMLIRKVLDENVV